MGEVIRLEHIVKRFYLGQPNELEILHDINFSVQEGEFVSIVGPSGSGKSTLMNLIGVLDRPTEGRYFLDGIDLSRVMDNELSDIRNKKIGFVFQTYNLIAKTNAQKNVELPMLYAGLGRSERRARARELLEMVEMTDRARHLPEELSGGQNRGWRLPGLWPTIRPSFWRMNPPELLIPRPDVWSWICFTGCTGSRARPLF